MKDITSTTHLSASTVLWTAIASLAKIYELSLKDLENILGFNQSTLSYFYQKEGNIDPQSKKGELAILLIRLYRGLSANLGGDDEAARAWLRSHHYYFNEPPLQRIRKITGLMEVIAYLEAIKQVNF